MRLMQKVKAARLFKIHLLQKYCWQEDLNEDIYLF